ncbi:DNA recombination protein RmuC [Idiomarina xiamenensis]|uniref:DNA recombination protein RmuC n=1 Tax=Idiomarina xiamenensis 10-D-4 TaxID=740709 RepID=K2KPE0_9GAMM|nr:DNA recombination protein RmuC [Idiomarina xiamenensis]EKE84264.1 DNA recombination protein RmuC [Idiomarina xiamenensis 10-D-4]
MLSLLFWQWALLLAAPLALLLVMLWGWFKQNQRQQTLQQQLQQLQVALTEAQTRSEQWQQQAEQGQQWQQRYEQLQQAHYQLQSGWQTQQATRQQEQQNQAEKLALLEASEARLQQQFENLANRIFEAKSKGLQERNQDSLKSTLEPFKQQIEAFKQQIQQQYTDETKERASLKTELLTLKSLNQRMSEEAEALTKALKGDNKQQGNWGEVVLERMLQQSGLREGYEYDTQSHHRDEDGRQFKPDVIVHLPNEKDVIIDSKVSLSAYERYFSAEQDDVRERALQEHVQSLRNHIKQLGNKNYQQLEQVRTLDYVLLFIPIEPAFLLAVDRDPELIRLALDNNIMLVSPTNLLVALRTINNIWQYEQQNRNAQRIATDAGKLYDKFVGFIDDMDKLGNTLKTADNRYQEAMKKLSSGRGNLVSRVEKFRELGVQTSKRIDNKLLDDDD